MPTTPGHALSRRSGSNTFEQDLGISDTTNLSEIAAMASVNRPQALNLTAVLEPDSASPTHSQEAANHNMLAVLTNLSSGDQANILASIPTLNGDGSTAAWTPSFVARNTLRTPSIYQVALATHAHFRLLHTVCTHRFLAEANNIFQSLEYHHLHATQTVTAVPAGGSPSAESKCRVATSAPTILRSTVLEGRIVQFGSRRTL